MVRTRLPCYRSRPGSLLLGLTTILVAVALGLPYLPGVAVFDFVPLPGRVMAAILGIVGLYRLATEIAKRRFYGDRHHERQIAGQAINPDSATWVCESPSQRNEVTLA